MIIGLVEQKFFMYAWRPAVISSYTHLSLIDVQISVVSTAQFLGFFGLVQSIVRIVLYVEIK